MTSSDNTGLGLFDDTASAVGNFPSALRGYDRSAVDDYVRNLEAKAVAGRRHAAELQQQLSELSDQLAEARHQASEIDYTNLGGRASDILRLAEEQARETLDRAVTDGERLKEEARREAELLRQDALREGNDLKSGGLAHIEQVRTQLQEDGRAQTANAKAEADALIAAARRQAVTLHKTADHDAQVVRQQAYLDTEQLKRTVEKEAADMRAQVAAERELAVAELRRVQEETSERTSALLAEATQHNQESAERLEADITEAARIRGDALAEAERVKLTAIREAEERLEAATTEARAITERTSQEFAWRKEQLRRETDLLGQRKQAVLNPLASLSALAQQTVATFPDIDDLDGFDAEQGDRTILRPTGAGSGVPDGNAAAGPETVTRTEQPQGRDDETPVRPSAPVPGPPDQAEPAQDGDATVLIPADQSPAGTAQRRPADHPSS